MAVNIIWLDPAATDTSGSQITEINFGDIIRPGEATETFKIGNTGDSVAEQVTVSADGADTEAVGWKSFSTDATNFSASVSLPDIGVNAISGEVSVKTTVDAAATTGTHTCNIVCDYIYA
jgi:hypothetical protein